MESFPPLRVVWCAWQKRDEEKKFASKICAMILLRRLEKWEKSYAIWIANEPPSLFPIARRAEMSRLWAVPTEIRAKLKLKVEANYTTAARLKAY